MPVENAGRAIRRPPMLWSAKSGNGSLNEAQPGDGCARRAAILPLDRIHAQPEAG